MNTGSEYYFMDILVAKTPQGNSGIIEWQKDDLLNAIKVYSNDMNRMAYLI